MNEAHDHGERCATLGCIVEQLPVGGEGHLFVIGQLKGGRRGPGFAHRIHVVVPLVDPVVGVLPVRRPGVVRRVHVGGEPVLEPVELIGPDEVHLAAQGSAVTDLAEVMGEGRNRRREFGGVVVGPDPCGQLPRHEGESRRRAQRGIAVRRVEPHARGRERVEIRRLDDRMAVGPGELGGQLIGHHHENVRSALHGGIVAPVTH